MSSPNYSHSAQSCKLFAQLAIIAGVLQRGSNLVTIEDGNEITRRVVPELL